MAYQEKYNIDLIEIIDLIEKNKLSDKDNVLKKFQQHVQDVVNVGRFSQEEWNQQWRKNVYKFGEIFNDLDPIDFLNILTSEKNGKDKDKQEVLDFYYSEIEWNSLPEDACMNRMFDLVKKYQYNPEFRHTLGHFYNRQKEYLKAIEQYRFAINKDKTSKEFIKNLFNSYNEYLGSMIESSEYNKGLMLCNELMNEGTFKESIPFNNYLVSIKERFKDHILLNSKIENAEIKIREIIAEQTQRGQYKVIEILGFFTAIIAFIFSTVSIGQNFSYSEAIKFNITLGLTLMSFVLSINLIFTTKNMLLMIMKISILLILVISLVLIAFLS